MRLPSLLRLVSLVLVSIAGQTQQPAAPVWPTPDHFWFRDTVPGG